MMVDKQFESITWYNNEFRLTEMFKILQETVEKNSPWHREKNVGIHTDMVVAQYLANMAAGDLVGQEAILGFMACAFHDVGKPAARQEKFKPERGHYVAFNGHELISARMWEDFAVSNWDNLTFINDDVMNIYRVAWLIEYHLPWDIKDSEKRSYLAKTLISEKMVSAFLQVLYADNRGRISDDREARFAKVDAWMEEFWNLVHSTSLDETSPGQPTLYLPIGPSGSGKSTYRVSLGDINAFSLDDLRHEFYHSTDYRKAYKMSVEDSKFSGKANARFVELIRTGEPLFVDNTNLTKKRRRQYIIEARRRGYKIHAILFPNTLQTLLDRQFTRGDKVVPEDAVRQQYNSLQLPSLGEVDSVEVIKQW